MPAYRSNTYVKLTSDSAGGQLTSEELLLIQSKVHLKIYEPVSNDTAEILFNDDGDVLMEWGGYYAS